ncbi:neuropeptide FF receptor 2-like [Dendronephthya gigantea]|uniref:neuropeptide FF receptor 2-like n=1 Tax=Dendronephthya gigantea TaxID=151771 RepID=UPI00106D109B|nr:neuropeptide FF receptor 2-like [Dendronephthya gigantea]
MNVTSTTNNTSNENNIDDPAAQARIPLFVSAFIPAFLVSEIGNAFVIYSLAYLKRGERTAVDCYILNLAIADFLMTTLSLFNAAEYLKNEWALGEGMCKIHGHMMEACYTASTFTLMTISYSRRKIANDPFKILNARRTLKRDIVLTWAATIVLTSPLSYAYTVAKRNGRLHCSNTNFDKTTRQIYYLLQAVILFFLPVSVMIASQRKITKGLKQHSTIYGASMQQKNAHWRRVMTHEKRVGKFLTWIWVVFVCCFAPHITLRTIHHFTSIRQRSEIWNQVLHAGQMLALLNSAINPFLYYRTTNKQGSYASRIVKLFCCLRQNTRSNLLTSSKQDIRMSTRTPSGSILH